MPTRVTRGLITGGLVGATVFAVDMLMSFIPGLAGLSNGAQIAIRVGLIAAVASLLVAMFT